MLRGSSLAAACRSLGHATFARRMLEGLGLVDQHGRRRYDRAGNPQLHDLTESARGAAGQPASNPRGQLQRLHPSEFSIKELAVATCGEEWDRRLSPESCERARIQSAVVPLLEAGQGAVMASAFADINAFTSVVAGLLEISVMEGWQLPEFIADQLAPAEPTKMFDGRKVIGTSRLGDQGEERLPGMNTKRAQFGERWITQPRTVENALACEVTQEAVNLDLTGEVLEQANGVGEWIGYRKELRVIDAWIGVTNTYTYKGVNYTTYQANGTWNNDVAGNELVHWTNVQTVELMFRDMFDPELTPPVRVLIRPNTLLVMQDKLHTAEAILGASDVEYRDAPGATTNPQQIRHFKNPLTNYALLTSPLVYQRLTAPDGLNLSPTVAGKYWWVFEKGKPLKYAQNWPLRVQQAAPNQLDMIDRGIVLFVKADERGIPMWYEPRRVVRSKP